jgi:hypothetical protein
MPNPIVEHFRDNKIGKEAEPGTHKEAQIRLLTAQEAVESLKLGRMPDPMVEYFRDNKIGKETEPRTHNVEGSVVEREDHR